MDENEKLYDVKQTAQFLNVDVRTVFRWVQLGRLRPFRIPSGAARFKRTDLLSSRERYEFGDSRPPHDPSLG